MILSTCRKDEKGRHLGGIDAVVSLDPDDEFIGGEKLRREILAIRYIKASEASQ